MNSVTGKRIIVTGPTSGVGKEIAIQLAGLGAEVILACRDIQKGNEVASEISQRTSAADVVVMEIDTSSQ
jgi:retinol dehydrogenase-11